MSRLIESRENLLWSKGGGLEGEKKTTENRSATSPEGVFDRTEGDMIMVDWIDRLGAGNLTASYKAEHWNLFRAHLGGHMNSTGGTYSLRLFPRAHEPGQRIAFEDTFFSRELGDALRSWEWERIRLLSSVSEFVNHSRHGEGTALAEYIRCQREGVSRLETWARTELARRAEEDDRAAYVENITLCFPGISRLPKDLLGLLQTSLRVKKRHRPPILPPEEFYSSNRGSMRSSRGPKTFHTSVGSMA